MHRLLLYCQSFSVYDYLTGGNQYEQKRISKKEQNTKAWQEDQALARFQMISPLLDEFLDQAKHLELMEQLSRQYQVSTMQRYLYKSGFMIFGTQS